MKKYIIYIVIGTIMTFTLVITRTMITRSAYEIRDAEIKIKTLNNEKRQIIVNLNHLKSPKRLEQIAITKFKMHRPEPKQIIKMQTDILENEKEAEGE